MVTYQDMMMFTALIVEVIGLVVMIMEYSDTKFVNHYAKKVDKRNGL